MNEKTRRLTFTAMFGAIASVLMVLEFPLPFLIPTFVKMDFSELPALIAGFAYGPVSGIAVCLIKNIVKLIIGSHTSGVGELCNFLLGVCFILPSSLIYKKIKTRKGALIGAAAGAVLMAVFSLPINYFISYPIYMQFLPLEAIISSYQEIIPGVNGLISCLIIFNMPFTLIKGIIDTILCFIIYKRISPVLHKK